MKISETARAKAGATEPLSPKIRAALTSGGDLSLLTPEEREQYYRSRCAQLGLDPNTTPLRYMLVHEYDPKKRATTFRTVLYAGKDATDTLRALHKVRITNAKAETHNDVVVVRVEAALPDGRTDIDVGAAPLADTAGLPLTPSQRANALMRAFTKAKRRVTLSITGAGLMDESDVDALEAEGLAERIHDPASIVSNPTAPPRCLGAFGRCWPGGSRNARRGGGASLGCVRGTDCVRAACHHRSRPAHDGGDPHRGGGCALPRAARHRARRRAHPCHCPGRAWHQAGHLVSGDGGTGSDGPSGAPVPAPRFVVWRLPPLVLLERSGASE
jgi:hypothetical protein